ncbi:hypothetical protein [Nocardia sp. GTS18]|uniref:DUF7373 family lipoprotein n=1 Tax=Nocardia sp. GTS18 TaxID=1778064 RepID=UPI0015EECFBF|nr:hypothetical protein [Nocardia sp. GTS18]
MRVNMRNTIALTVAAITISAAAACSNPNTNTSDIELDKLDVGNYQTMPAAAEAFQNSESGSLREAINIGSHTPLPFEYDHRFEFGNYFGYRQHVTRSEPPDGFDNTGVDAENFNAEIPGLVAGWQTFGQRRFEPDFGRQIKTYTLRFETASAAANAVHRISERAAGENYPIADQPNTITKVTPGVFYGGTMESWTSHHEMLLYIKVGDPVSRPYEAAESASIAKKFFDKQLAMLKDYEPTPLAEIPKLQLDIDNLLAHTLPSEDGRIKSAVYPARVALSLSKYTKLMSNAFTDAGVDYYTSGGLSRVWRARDAAAAERLSTALRNGSLDLIGLRPSGTHPPGLPSAKCYEVDPADPSYANIPPQCFITVGRFAARIGGANMQDTHQRTAAQYKLLTLLK